MLAKPFCHLLSSERYTQQTHILSLLYSYTSYHKHPSQAKPNHPVIPNTSIIVPHLTHSCVLFEKQQSNARKHLRQQIVQAGTCTSAAGRSCPVALMFMRLRRRRWTTRTLHARMTGLWTRLHRRRSRWVLRLRLRLGLGLHLWLCLWVLVVWTRATVERTAKRWQVRWERRLGSAWPVLRVLRTRREAKRLHVRTMRRAHSVGHRRPRRSKTVHGWSMHRVECASIWRGLRWVPTVAAVWRRRWEAVRWMMVCGRESVAHVWRRRWRLVHEARSMSHTHLRWRWVSLSHVRRPGWVVPR
jgi:hypothetical protein